MSCVGLAVSGNKLLAGRDLAEIEARDTPRGAQPMAGDARNSIWRMRGVRRHLRGVGRACKWCGAAAFSPPRLRCDEYRNIDNSSPPNYIPEILRAVCHRQDSNYNSETHFFVSGMAPRRPRGWFAPFTRIPRGLSEFSENGVFRRGGAKYATPRARGRLRRISRRSRDFSANLGK